MNQVNGLPWLMPQKFPLFNERIAQGSVKKRAVDNWSDV
jgi:hypothetical protein